MEAAVGSSFLFIEDFIEQEEQKKGTGKTFLRGKEFFLLQCRLDLARIQLNTPNGDPSTNRKPGAVAEQINLSKVIVRFVQSSNLIFLFTLIFYSQ